MGGGGARRGRDGTPHKREIGANRQASKLPVLDTGTGTRLPAHVAGEALRAARLARLFGHDSGLYRSKSNNYNELKSHHTPRSIGREFHHLASGGMRKA